MSAKRIIAVAAVIIVFLSVNLFLFFKITRRLGNNYSGTGQMKMIDVSRYLPFENDSQLGKVESSLGFREGDDLPVLDGAAALVPVYASVIENCYPEGSVKYEGGEFSDDNYYGENFSSDSAMLYRNTIRGFKGVIEGTSDLFFSAYPSDEQLEFAAENGAELEIVPVGREAFVFFVSRNNPVENLSSDQIREIYSGKIQSWREVGGEEKAINPLVRSNGSGSQTMMEKFMGEKKIANRNLFAIFGASIGYSFRYYLSGMVPNENVKMISVDGIYPDVENIKNGDYPLSTFFYVIYRKDNTNPNLPRLVDWILSEAGQEMMEKCGYVGVK